MSTTPPPAARAHGNNQGVSTNFNQGISNSQYDRQQEPLNDSEPQPTLLEPTLPQAAATTTREGDDDYGAVLPPPKTCDARSWDQAKELTTAVAAAATVGTSVASAVMGVGAESASTVLLSSFGAAALGTTVASCAALQQRQVSHVHALQRDVGKLREDLTQRQEENEALLATVREQEGSLSHAQDMEDALEMIRHTEGQSLDELNRQLEESRQILGQINANHRAMILQHLTAFLLEQETTDTERGKLDQEAMDRLLERIEAEHPITINQDAVQHVVERQGEDGTLAVVMEMVQNLLSEDDLHPRHVIFQFDKWG